MDDTFLPVIVDNSFHHTGSASGFKDLTSNGIETNWQGRTRIHHYYPHRESMFTDHQNPVSSLSSFSSQQVAFLCGFQEKRYGFLWAAGFTRWLSHVNAVTQFDEVLAASSFLYSLWGRRARTLQELQAGRSTDTPTVQHTPELPPFLKTQGEKHTTESSPGPALPLVFKIRPTCSVAEARDVAALFTDRTTKWTSLVKRPCPEGIFVHTYAIDHGMH